MNTFLPRLLIVLGCLILGSCASYSGIAPEARVFKEDSLKGNPSDTSFATWPKEDWWHELNDAVLTTLIEQSLADSPSLQAAIAKTDRARALAGQAESAIWPQLDASVSTTRERFSRRGLIPPPYAGTTQDINDAQIAGRWELDFFGKNRENLKAALGELRSTEVELQAARMLLSTNVARSYYNLARLLAQRQVAEQRSRQRLELAALVERRVKAGLDTDVERETAHGATQENARDIAAYDEQIGLARHALAALIGQGPEAVDSVAPALPDIAPLELPSTLPAGLLGHRADVVAARWRVESALHGLESTKALFYPNINLRAFTGFSAIGFDNWLDTGSRQPGIGLAISLPVFDAGRLRNLYRATAASVDSAVATYNSALLEALRDVADQLTSLQALEIQLSRQRATLTSAERSHDLALQRYQAGIADRLTVLNAETNLITQRQTATDLQARWIDGRIRLIRALGGGFEETREDPSMAQTPLPSPRTGNAQISSQEKLTD